MDSDAFIEILLTAINKKISLLNKNNLLYIITEYSIFP